MCQDLVAETSLDADIISQKHWIWDLALECIWKNEENRTGQCLNVYVLTLENYVLHNLACKLHIEAEPTV